MKPGAITDWERIWSPPAIQDVLNRVENMALPAATEVAEVFDEMANGSGVLYRQFMSVIGGCIVCDQVMALPNILTHRCIGHTQETGLCPAKYPRLPEDRRILPAAGSCIKKEVDHAGQVHTKADNGDGDNDDNVEFVDGINGMLPFILLRLALVLIMMCRYSGAQA